MISRAARVPRICRACRSGLVQRSAMPGFRAVPFGQRLAQQRCYVSEANKIDQNRINSFTISKTSKVDSKNIAQSTEGQAEHEDVANESKTSPTDADLCSSEEANRTSEQTSISAEEVQETQRVEQQKEDDSPSTEPPSKRTDLKVTSSFEPPTTFVTIQEAESFADDFPEDQFESKTKHNDELEDEEGSIFDLPEFNEPLSKSQTTSPEYPRRSRDGASSFELPVFNDANHIPARAFRHNLLHDAPLGVSALGVPADAIIIKNPNQMRPEKRAAVEIAEQPLQPTTDITWGALSPKDGDEELTLDEVFANINDMRPDAMVMRAAEINKLVAALCEGFYIEQMRDYLRFSKIEERGWGMVTYPWAEKQIPWMSHKTARPRGNDKATLAQKIVLLKWKIEVQEYVDDVGRGFVWMDPDFFPFLTHNSGRVLQDLRKNYLVEENDKLTLNSKQCRINITARKVTAYSILARLDYILSKIESRTIPISKFTRDTPSVAELKELSRITNTTIKLIREGKEEKLKVSWLPDNLAAAKKESPMEDQADIVLRLIVGRPSKPITHNVHCFPTFDAKDTDKHFISFHREVRNLAWRDKLRSWVRYVSPVGNEAALSTALDLAQAPSFPAQSTTDFETTTTATFGHVLFSETDNPVAKRTKSRRVFSPFIPHPASFSALKPDVDAALVQSTTIILNLAPHVERGSEADKTAPVVRVRLPVDPEADLSSFSVSEAAAAHCVVPWRIDEIMLPTENVDVRLKHERSQPLDINQPGLKDFLETSEFNLLAGRLRTPSQMTLSIPNSWLRRRGSDNGESTTTDIPYGFRGLEIHQTVEIPWRGHTLRYSSIEAGQHGGQRQELTLQAGNSGEPMATFAGEQRKSFLALVEELATGKCFSWTQGAKAIKHRSLEDFSYDLPEEHLTEDIVIEADKFDQFGRLNRWKSDEPREVEEEEDVLDYKPRSPYTPSPKTNVDLEGIDTEVEKRPEPRKEASFDDEDLASELFDNSASKAGRGYSEGGHDALDNFGSDNKTNDVDINDFLDQFAPRPRGSKPSRSADSFAKRFGAARPSNPPQPREPCQPKESSPESSIVADDLFAQKFAAARSGAGLKKSLSFDPPPRRPKTKTQRRKRKHMVKAAEVEAENTFQFGDDFSVTATTPAQESSVTNPDTIPGNGAWESTTGKDRDGKTE